APNLYAPFAPQESMLREYLRVLIKRRWVVLASVVVIFGVVAIATMRATRIYDASGSIAINKADPMMFNFKDGQGGGGMGETDTSDIDTEVRILKSDLLALQVIKELNLDKRPEFGGSQTSSDGLALTTDALQPDSQETTNLLNAFKSGLTVSTVSGTRIIDIHYRSPDRSLAARVVNTLMNTYVEQNFKTRFESTMQASDWLSKQLVDLQVKVQTSQEKL